MARSMVSIGTEASRAFWNIVRSVGLASRSPPPSRAATSTWRISLAKSLPRALSAAPFLCLIVAHLEWPDIGLLTIVAIEEQLVEPAGRRDSSGWNAATMTAPWRHSTGSAVDRGQHLDAGADPLDDRAPG